MNRQFFGQGSFCAAAVLAMLSGSAFASVCPTTVKLVHGDRQANDALGSVLAADLSANSAPTIFAGIPLDDTPQGQSAGTVRVFRKSNGAWAEAAQRLEGAPSFSGARFGSGVASDDPRVIVGSEGESGFGAAWFFVRNGTNYTVGFHALPVGQQAGQLFGHAVGISGEWAAVSAPEFDSDGSPNPGLQNPGSGAVYLFKRNANETWSNLQTVTWADQIGSFTNSHHGESLALSGDLLVVGAPHGTLPAHAIEHGYVKFYRRSGNTFLADGNFAYFSNNEAAGDHYGSAVAADADLVAIGAPDDDATVAHGGSVHSNSGCVYIQRYSGGTYFIDGQIFASDLADNARFGASVAIKGNRLVVGAPGAGKTYVFVRRGAFDWVQERVFTPSDAADSFGTAVSFDGMNVGTGDPTDDPAGFANAGAVYAFDAAATTGNDTCAGATVIGAGTVTGCTSTALRDGFTTCGTAVGFSNGPDVWYSWTPACSGNVSISTFGSNFDTVLSVHTDCPSGADSRTLACNDDAGGFLGTSSLLNFAYSGGTTYLIRVSGFNGASGNSTLIVDPSAPSNDTCANALPVSAGTTFGCNETASSDGGSSCDAAQTPGKDVWYRYTASCNGAVTIDTEGTAFDTILSVHGGCPGTSANAIVCNDDIQGGFDLASRVTLSTLAGHSYLIRVSGYNGASGPFTLNVGACVNPCLAAADFNHDGFVDPDDLADFIAAYFATPVGPGTDVNGDGVVDPDDLSDYIALFFGGCP